MAEVLTLAQQLAEAFRPKTTPLDQTAEFPKASYQQMREVGYLRAAVPNELGGLGADLAEMARAQQALARGCAATALAVNMHQLQVGAMANAWRKGGSDVMLRRVAEEGVVLASTSAEALVAGVWTTPATARLEGDHYYLTGRKFFCSQAPGMDFVRVNARDLVSGDILVFSIPATLEGVQIVETWDTTGMRATASHDLVLEDVRMPANAAVLVRLPASGPLRHPAFANVARWFFTLVSSVYLGVAEEARAEVHNMLKTGLGSVSRAPVLSDVLLGEIEAEFLSARSVRDQTISELDGETSDLQAALARAILCKEIVTKHAQNTVEKAIQIVGGRSYFKRSPLERLARDVRAAQFHPPAAPASLQMVGKRLREQIATAHEVL